MDEEDMRGPQTWGQQEDRNPYYGSMVRLYNKTKDDNSTFLCTGGAYYVHYSFLLIYN
jgi:hypothetical protein